MKPIANVNELFRQQRAIRNFTDEDVPDELVNQVLSAAIHAPSGSNTQPWHFIVIRDQAVKNAISEVYEEARATYSRPAFRPAHRSTRACRISC
jgi:nitroreductase